MSHNSHLQPLKHTNVSRSISPVISSRDIMRRKGRVVCGEMCQALKGLLSFVRRNWRGTVRKSCETVLPASNMSKLPLGRQPEHPDRKWNIFEKYLRGNDRIFSVYTNNPRSSNQSVYRLARRLGLFRFPGTPAAVSYPSEGSFCSVPSLGFNYFSPNPLFLFFFSFFFLLQ